MSLVDDVADTVFDSVESVKAYLASNEGREMRRKVATGLIFGAPLISRLPIMRATKLGRVVGFAGGAAILVKAAELIRDWEPTSAPAQAAAEN